MELKEILQNNLLVNEQLKDSVVSIEEFRGDISLILKKENFLEVCKYLRDNNELQFLSCRDVTAIDWAKRKDRFTVVYNLYSYKLNTHLRLKLNLDGEYPQTESVTSIWKSANWYERETYDMYGIKFLNHPDLRRMYMPEEFEYHPLRKEFPVLGIPGSIPLPEKGV